MPIPPNPSIQKPNFGTKVEQYNLVVERNKRENSIFFNKGFLAFVVLVLCIFTLYFCHLSIGEAKQLKNVYFLRHFHYNKMIFATTSNLCICVILIHLLKNNCNFQIPNNFLGNSVKIIFFLGRILILGLTFLALFNAVKL